MSSRSTTRPHVVSHEVGEASTSGESHTPTEVGEGTVEETLTRSSEEEKEYQRKKNTFGSLTRTWLEHADLMLPRCLYARQSYKPSEGSTVTPEQERRKVIIDTILGYIHAELPRLIDASKEQEDFLRTHADGFGETFDEETARAVQSQRKLLEEYEAVVDKLLKATNQESEGWEIANAFATKREIPLDGEPTILRGFPQKAGVDPFWHDMASIADDVRKNREDGDSLEKRKESLQDRSAWSRVKRKFGSA